MTARSHIHARPTHPSVFTGLFGRLAAAHAVWRQRRALSRLDDAALKDIGVSRGEAHREARRPAWDVPAHWRC